MRRTRQQPYFSKSWAIALLIGLLFVAAGYGLKFEIESVDNPDARSWLNLALFLCGYLFFLHQTDADGHSSKTAPSRFS